MNRKKNTYTLNDFLQEDDKLQFSKYNTLYQAYFEVNCYDNEHHFSYCPPNENYHPLTGSILELYKKFERNIKLIWDEEKEVYKNVEENKKELCFYLKYWLYDQIIDKNIDSELSQFWELWKNRKTKNCPNCTCEFEVQNISDINVLKTIYDYILFKDTYDNEEKINAAISKKKFCPYIDDARILYSLKKTTCTEKTGTFCNEIKKYIIPHLKIDDNFVITCNNEEESDHYPHNGQVLGNLSYGTQKEEHGKRSVILEERELDSGAETPLRGLVPVEGAAAIEEGRVVGGENEGMEDNERDRESEIKGDKTPFLPIVQSGRGSPDNDLSRKSYESDKGDVNLYSLPDSTENGNSNGTIISASGVGLTGFLFILYKFTPIRTWIDPRIRKTKKELRNGINESNELQSHDYNFHYADMDINRYNIAYQSR
ncbi:Plasmodium vivax Vir protein, putative [Plasmodium vivax]|uniref:Vir protein, putative n=1 Tax=Plasmodium vivax TaxID=5855 RepID=A0A1G4E1U0_PLAVI|nr:Plasmodium vivax Vir protein, putative [Plasmodium vivax]